MRFYLYIFDYLKYLYHFVLLKGLLLLIFEYFEVLESVLILLIFIIYHIILTKQYTHEIKNKVMHYSLSSYQLPGIIILERSLKSLPKVSVRLYQFGIIVLLELEDFNLKSFDLFGLSLFLSSNTLY